MKPMTGIGLEWYKCRRRQVPLVCLGLLGAQMVWMGVFLLRQEQEDLAQGWMLLLYNLALVDAIMLPLTVAVLASRNCEGEHKGSTWKLLETMVTPGQLYAAKLGWGTVVLAVLLLARSGLFIALGLLLDLPGGVPWGRWGWFTLISLAVSLALYTLQQGLSLRFANQAVALVVGLCGSFLGLLSLLFPVGIQRCFPWGYYGLLLLVQMHWEEATRITTFSWRTPEPLDVFLLVVWWVAFGVIGYGLFARKEE